MNLSKSQYLAKMPRITTLSRPAKKHKQNNSNSISSMSVSMSTSMSMSESMTTTANMRRSRTQNEKKNHRSAVKLGRKTEEMKLVPLNKNNSQISLHSNNRAHSFNDTRVVASSSSLLTSTTPSAANSEFYECGRKMPHRSKSRRTALKKERLNKSENGNSLSPSLIFPMKQLSLLASTPPSNRNSHSTQEKKCNYNSSDKAIFPRVKRSLTQPIMYVIESSADNSAKFRKNRKRKLSIGSRNAMYSTATVLPTNDNHSNDEFKHESPELGYPISPLIKQQSTAPDFKFPKANHRISAPVSKRARTISGSRLSGTSESEKGISNNTVAVKPKLTASLTAPPVRTPAQKTMRHNLHSQSQTQPRTHTQSTQQRAKTRPVPDWANEEQLRYALEFQERTMDADRVFSVGLRTKHVKLSEIFDGRQYIRVHKKIRPINARRETGNWMRHNSDF